MQTQTLRSTRHLLHSFIQPPWVWHESFSMISIQVSRYGRDNDSFPGEVTRRWPPNLGLPAAPLGVGSPLEGSWSSVMFWLLLSAPLGLLSLCSGCVLTVFPDPYLCSCSVVWVLYCLQRHLSSSLELFVLTSFTFQTTLKTGEHLHLCFKVQIKNKTRARL